MTVSLCFAMIGVFLAHRNESAPESMPNVVVVGYLSVLYSFKTHFWENTVHGTFATVFVSVFHVVLGMFLFSFACYHRMSVSVLWSIDQTACRFFLLLLVSLIHHCSDATYRVIKHLKFIKCLMFVLFKQDDLYTVTDYAITFDHRSTLIVFHHLPYI